jgi:hypothetical protein
MSTPGSSGKAGPTPIPDECNAQALTGEQVRPSFHFGMHTLHLGDTVTGVHRLYKSLVSGTVILMYGCICLSTVDGIFPVTRIAIHSVQDPDFLPGQLDV